MAKRVLIGCFEVPGWGGASTSAYQLYRRMRKDEFEVEFVNIIAEDDAAFFRHTFQERVGNPQGLPGVKNCFLEGPNYDPHPELRAIIEEFAPKILLGVGWIAALLMKRAAENTPLVFLTTGCEQLKSLLAAKRFHDYLALERYLRDAPADLGRPAAREYEALLAADVVVAHSEITRLLFDHFFPRLKGKIYRDVIWFAEWIADEAARYTAAAKPFHDRSIDVLFVASSWSRPEKNYEFVKRLSRRLAGREVHVVGDTEEQIAGAIHHGVISLRANLFELLGDAKTVVCTSSFDAAPGVLFEGSVMGCNVVTSRNCGNWKLCHPDLLVDPFTVKVFHGCIERSLEKEFDDYMVDFTQAKSYKKLKNIIMVL